MNTLTSLPRRHMLSTSVGALAAVGLASFTRGASAQAAWAKSLRDNNGIPQSEGDGYPIAMHEDLMLRGFWDESGASYSTPAVAHVIDDTLEK